MPKRKQPECESCGAFNHYWRFNTELGWFNLCEECFKILEKLVRKSQARKRNAKQ